MKFNMKIFGGLLLTFVVLIISLTLLPVIGDETAALGNLDTVSETLAITSSTGQTARTDVRAVTFFGNATLNTSVSGITVGEQVNFTEAGVVTVAGGNFTDSPNYSITYSDGNAKYITNVTARTLINLVVIFFVLAIVAYAIWFGYNSLKESGMM